MATDRVAVPDPHFHGRTKRHLSRRALRFTRCPDDPAPVGLRGKLLQAYRLADAASKTLQVVSAVPILPADGRTRLSTYIGVPTGSMLLPARRFLVGNKKYHLPLLAGKREYHEMQGLNALAVDDRANHSARLLVVEDEVLIRMVVCDMLRDAGYDVIEAVSGDEALDILKAGVVVDLVLSDVRMPGTTDGMALLAFVRQNLADLPVIITSGHLAPEVALAEGAAYFLAKPFRVADALKVIEAEVSKLQ